MGIFEPSEQISVLLFLELGIVNLVGYGTIYVTYGHMSFLFSSLSVVVLSFLRSFRFLCLVFILFQFI